MTPEKRKELHDMLDKMLDVEPVNFIRIAASPAKPDELVRGKGPIVGILIGVNRRINVMCKDAKTSENKAWNLEPVCVNANAATAQAYFDHRQKLNGVAEEFNKKAEQMIKDGNEAVDKMNANMFGPALKI